MSAYTDAVSKPGKKTNAGVDDRELFLDVAGDMVLEAYEETFDFTGKTFVKNIQHGKAVDFPIIGRKRDAADHVPGEIILGGGIEHNEVTISLDNVLVDSAFIADIDEMLLHYEIGRPYATQLGQSLAAVDNARIAQSFVNASRETVAPYTGGPVPSYDWDAAMATDASKMEDAAFAGIQYIRENDVAGDRPTFYLPWQQQLLFSRWTGIDTEATSGAGDRSLGTVGKVAGLAVKGTNSVPNTNVATGPAKYQGDFTTTVGMITTMMGVGTLRRKGITVRVLDQGDRIGTLMIAHALSGHGALRAECSFEVASATR